MSANKNIDPTDELFKKTFENLSNTSSANGWDAPSDRVWQNVQQNIGSAPASSGSNPMRVFAAAAAVSMVAAGIYFFTKKEKTAPPILQEKPVAEQPVSAQPVENQAVTSPVTGTSSVSMDKTKTAKPTLPIQKTVAKPAPATSEPPKNSTQAKEPGAEKPQQYDHKNAPAIKKATALPMPDKKQGRPKMPAPRNHVEEPKPNGN